jgi:hypothetical protein
MAETSVPIEDRIRYAMLGIIRALDNFERYDRGTYGRRDAKQLLANSIETLIDTKLEHHATTRHRPQRPPTVGDLMQIRTKD